LTVLPNAIAARLEAIPYKWAVATVFIFGLFMDLMDTTIVNVAIPSLSRDFRASTSLVEWTVTGYLLALAVVIPASGWLADRFGTKRVFLTAMAVFIAGSAACGLAQNIEQLIAARFFQGLGGGMMTPVGTAMLSREFPGAERAKASAIISVPVVVAPTFGPVLGGWLVEDVSWRWIFYVNLPVGVIGFLVGLELLREHREAYAQRGIDIIGLITGSAGAALALYAVTRAGSEGFGAGEVVVTGMAGLALLAIFAFWELRIEFPVLDLRLFKRWFYTITNAMMMPSFAAFSGFILLLTLFMQELRGYSPLQAGLIQAPASVGTAISLPLASRIYPRMGPRKMMLAGYSLSAATMLPFHFVGLGTPLWLVIIFLVLRGLPFAFAVVAAQTLLFGPIESEKQGPASAAYNTLRQLAASFGVALIITIALNRTRVHESATVDPLHAAVMGYQDAYLAIFALLLVPFALAFLIDDRRAHRELQARTALSTRAEAAEAAG